MPGRAGMNFYTFAAANSAAAAFTAGLNWMLQAKPRASQRSRSFQNWHVFPRKAPTFEFRRGSGAVPTLIPRVIFLTRFFHPREMYKNRKSQALGR